MDESRELWESALGAIVSVILAILLIIAITGFGDLENIALAGIGAIVSSVIVVSIMKYFDARLEAIQERRRQAVEQLAQTRMRHAAQDWDNQPAIRPQFTLPEQPPTSFSSRNTNQPALFLRDILVMLDNRDGTKRIGRVVNPELVRAVRPAIVFEVNKPEFVGRPIQMQFDILTPDGETRFSCTETVTLTTGLNKFVPSFEYPLRKRHRHGQWVIHIWLIDREWGERAFSITTVDPSQLAGTIGSDMEITPEAINLANRLNGGFSIDDLLNS